MRFTSGPALSKPATGRGYDSQMVGTISPNVAAAAVALHRSHPMRPCWMFLTRHCASVPVQLQTSALTFTPPVAPSVNCWQRLSTRA